ncbi:hypothetical protein Sn110110_011 [Cyanophage S-RIM14]|uniref:Phage tail lysozyme domain-containing protein n=1 Tax=Cyanophage S-RIM14 TaxID=1278423 RepID=A0A1D7SKE5_9CAUD|nr:hypothetical protein Sn110110_011 [Cyanophage S-RIM14]
MAKLGYKFVNPSLSSKDKETLKSSGVKTPNAKKLPSGKIVLGINRLGAATDSIYTSIRGLKSIEEVRAISLRNKEVDERRADRDRQLDQKEASQERGAAVKPIDEKKVGKEVGKKDKKLKKKGSFLQQLLTPIWNLIKPFIKFAAIIGIMKWFSDEKNVEKVKKLVEFTKVIFDFLWKWGTFGVTNLMDGLAGLFGGISKIMKGDLGGVWESIMGFGQLLVGLLALKGLAMFLNPFSMMGGILDLLGMLSSDDDSGLDRSKSDPDGPDKPKTKKPKTWLGKLRQRIRIMYKRLKGRWLKKVLGVFSIIGVFLADLSSKIARWGANFFKNVVKPKIAKAVARAVEAFKNSLPPSILKRLSGGLDAIKAGGEGLLQRADEITKPLQNAGKKAFDIVEGFRADPRQALSETKDAAKKRFIDPITQGGSDLLKWFSNTRFGKQVGQGIDIAKGAWDITSEFAIAKFKQYKEGLEIFLKTVQELPQTVSSNWTKLSDNITNLAAKGKDFVVDKFLAPLKATASDLIEGNPVTKFFIDKFKGKAGKEGGEGLFKKFVKIAKPAVLGTKNALEAAPFKIGPLDVIVETLFAAMELKAGQDPRRVALKLAGSIAGLVAGTAILGAIGAGTGGIGAAILAGVVTGATQWGGEWLADKLADVIGLPKKDVSFMDAFNFDKEKLDAATPDENLPEKAAGGLVRNIKMSMGGSVLDPTKTGSSNLPVWQAAQKARAEARAEGLTPEEVEKRVVAASEAELLKQQPVHKRTSDTVEKQKELDKKASPPPPTEIGMKVLKAADPTGGAASILLGVMKSLFPNAITPPTPPDAEDKSTSPTTDSDSSNSITSGGGYTGDPGKLAVSGSVTAKGVDISKKIMSDTGATKQAAAAISGNMAHESAGFIPGIREGGPFGKNSKPWPQGTVRKGYGWAQWTNSAPGDRYDKFIASYGGDYSKIPSNSDNYKFLMSELMSGNGGFIRKGTGTSGSWGEFKQKTDVANATVDFRKTWERAGVAHDGPRIKYAKSFLAKMSGGGRVNSIAKASQSVAAIHEQEEQELVVVPIPKVIPMPINRTRGTKVITTVTGKADHSIRFENY